MIDKPHQSNLRKGRFSQLNGAYFVTKCVQDDERTVLNSEISAPIIINSFKWMVEHGFITLGGFVIMNDHYHLILALLGNKSLSQAIASIDQYSANEINLAIGHKGKVWQKGLHDHAIRNYEDYLDILHYIHNNPLRRNLAASIELYKYSTANADYQELIDWEWFHY
jgi:REP element-mobilizing transposase RayT